jgi:hypothetical protein
VRYATGQCNQITAIDGSFSGQADLMESTTPASHGLLFSPGSGMASGIACRLK